MEASPLVRAHDHARAAAAATRHALASAPPTMANQGLARGLCGSPAVSEQHALAADAFATAARDTSSNEALRTLHLLEKHHRRLAALMKLAPAQPCPEPSPADASDPSPEPPHKQQQPAASQPQLQPPAPRQTEQEGLDSGPSVVAKDSVAASPAPSAASTSAATLTPTPTLTAATAPAKPAAPSSTALAPPSPPPPPPPPPAAARPVPSRSQHHQKRPFASRDMTSSIASNLASARGIRSRAQPLSPSGPSGPSRPSQQAAGALDAPSRRDAPSRTRMRSNVPNEQDEDSAVSHGPSLRQHYPGSRARRTTPPRTQGPPPGADDGGYARFYSTFGSLINKISAPLAFAGLPLIQEESMSLQEAPGSVSPGSSPPALSKQKGLRPVQSQSISPEPDLSTIYSKATMRALVHGSTSESFYVVPATGHSMSYANILSYAEKEKRRHEAADDDDDDFVDARETPVPSSPGISWRKPPRHQGDRELRNTVEELSVENRSLKDMLDNVSKRLHAFEASSQHSTMALAESYRFVRPASPKDQGGRAKTAGSEDELAAVLRQLDRAEREKRRMQKSLEKYRDKWELLKAGAKARREAQGGDSIDEDGRQS
ncbi:hypothetical protein CDD82_4062 [Ophiocordyceps australis]|uniref:Uncharacterized protein n=1 Tax=Ophiocordyceps australis TaxID=1399860 RepID=A0A2C5Z8S8_9HYPO|nr:hypothetical protein CDD82_4062 [Ophiocordyceps australis]